MMQDDDGGKLVEKLAEHFLTEDPDSVGWANITDGYRNQLRGRAEHALSAIEREGFKVVPVEPTEEMVDAVRDPRRANGSALSKGFHDTWQTALSAAPKQG